MENNKKSIGKFENGLDEFDIEAMKTARAIKTLNEMRPNRIKGKQPRQKVVLR